MSSISSDNSNRADQARADLAEQYRAQQTEKDKIQDQNEKEIARLKENYELEKTSLGDRFEASVQSEKLNHYANLRNLKRDIQKEEQRLENARHEIVEGKTNELTHEQMTVQRDGNAHLNELKTKFAQTQEYERAREIAANEEVSTKHHKNAEAIIKDSNTKIAALQTQKEQEVETSKATHAQAIDEIKGHYNNLRSQTEQTYYDELKNTQTRTAADLSQRKLSNSQWLSKYSERQEDPFYQLTRFDSALSDAGDAFVLRVKVPDYERDKFHVQISGQELQITGTRSNNEKAEVEPGRWVNTASYQNVSEKFNLPVPVDGHSLTRREDGDFLEFTIQKYGPEHRMSERALVKANIRDDKELSAALDFPSSLPRPTPLSNKA
jgi:HSP20 family molecular chaperone IbpA